MVLESLWTMFLCREGCISRRLQAFRGRGGLLPKLGSSASAWFPSRSSTRKLRLRWDRPEKSRTEARVKKGGITDSWVYMVFTKIWQAQDR